jgi:hypothetical protein
MKFIKESVVTYSNPDEFPPTNPFFRLHLMRAGIDPAELELGTWKSLGPRIDDPEGILKTRYDIIDL